MFKFTIIIFFISRCIIASQHLSSEDTDCHTVYVRPLSIGAAKKPLMAPLFIASFHIYILLCKMQAKTLSCNIFSPRFLYLNFLGDTEKKSCLSDSLDVKNLYETFWMLLWTLRLLMEHPSYAELTIATFIWTFKSCCTDI